MTIINAYIGPNHSDKTATIKALLNSNAYQDGENAYIYLTSSQMRKLAEWLVKAAEILNPSPNQDIHLVYLD